MPPSLALSALPSEIRGVTSCLCRGISTPFLSVSQKRREWRFKSLFFSSRLLVHLFDKIPLKSPFCRFKRHANPSLRFRLALPHPDLASAGVAMGGKKADNQLVRCFRNQSLVYFFLINILFLIIFIMKILPEKRQLKSSDSSRKKAASNRKRPFTTCFHLIY